MNPEIKAEWVAALRSGEYRQGKGMLRTPDDRFCCLGVLCDLAVGHGVIPEPTPNVLNDSEVDQDAQWEYGAERNPGVLPFSVGSPWGPEVLPFEVMEWADLPTLNPHVGEGPRPSPLSEWNDEQGASFDEIADLIEEYL